LIGVYFFLVLLFYWFFLYSYFSYILILLLVEGIMVIVFLYFAYISDMYLLSLEVIFLIMRIIVFDGVIGLCLLINNYRVFGINYYRL